MRDRFALKAGLLITSPNFSESPQLRYDSSAFKVHSARPRYRLGDQEYLDGISLTSLVKFLGFRKVIVEETIYWTEVIEP